MLGTPGHPLITAEWQIGLVLALGFVVAAILHRIARRMVARDRSRDHDDRGD
jgi:membrane protein implicated in regulation of membrane protease activity